MPVLPEVADVIEARMDAFILQALNLHDVGKALPHPYNAIGEMASKIAHDFINDAYRIKRYIQTVEGRTEDGDALDPAV